MMNQMMNEPNQPNRQLSKGVIEAMTDDDLHDLYRLLMRAQLAHLHEYTAPCDHAHSHDEPHGMHSDDGHDYLDAAITLAAELLDRSCDLNTSADFKAWLIDKIDPASQTNITYYACDGIAELLNEMLWTDELEAAVESAFQNFNKEG